jgi:hypothetical protein
MVIIPCFEDYVFEKSSLDITVNNETDTNGNIFKINITDEDGTPKTYSVTNDKIMLIKDDKSEEEVTDETLKKAIIRAVRNIKNVKKKIKYSYVDRVINDCSDELEDEIYDDIETGKLDTNITNSLKDILLDNNKPNVNNEFDCMHLNILSSTSKDLHQTLEKWFKKSLHSIGKGEFLLPIIYSDVKKIHKGDKGDDVLIQKPSDNINIEVKTAGAGFKVKREYYGSADNEEHRLKLTFLKSLLTYAKGRNLDNLFLFIFDNKIKNTSETDKVDIDTPETTTQEDENNNGSNEFSSCLVINCGKTFGPSRGYFKSIQIDNDTVSLYNKLKDKISIELKECNLTKKSSTDFFIEYNTSSEDNKTLVFYTGKDKFDSIKIREKIKTIINGFSKDILNKLKIDENDDKEIIYKKLITWLDLDDVRDKLKDYMSQREDILYCISEKFKEDISEDKLNSLRFYISYMKKHMNENQQVKKYREFIND